jgi:hypothetical protein
MNPDKITMDADQAQRKMEAALRERHADALEFHQACAAAYQHLANGRQLLSLSAAIRAGGIGADGRPRFAVARADRPQVYLEWRRNNPIVHYCAETQPTAWHAGRFASLNRFVDLRQTFDDARRSLRTGYARVPAVPADVRPAVGQLRDWFILWEVDEWADRSHLAPPPRDPFLLEPIGGDLYAILAHWELTDLERAIMDSLNRPN